MRYIEIFGLATSSGANVRKSSASRSTIAVIGWRTCVSYCSRCALNHSRRLLRPSPRRNLRVSALKRGAVPGMSAGRHEFPNQAIHLGRPLANDPVRALRHALDRERRNDAVEAVQVVREERRVLFAPDDE